MRASLVLGGFVVVLAPLSAADLPLRQVTLYKHGVAFFERAGELKPGDTVRLDFKAGDMNDILKSLTLAGTVKVGAVRYDASDPLSKRLADFPFQAGAEMSLAAFLDQMKGARIDLAIGSQTVSGAVVSARAVHQPDKPGEQQTLVLLTDAGELRAFDLGAATAIKPADPKLQAMLKDYLSILAGARSKDRRSVQIEVQGNATGALTAAYMTPSAVWKSAYRLIFGAQPQPLLEGWAIIDNTSGEDWTGVKLSVVSGRPVSFITQLYEPRYVQRPFAELAENQAARPMVFEGELAKAEAAGMAGAPPPPPAVREARRFAMADSAVAVQEKDVLAPAPMGNGSSVATTSQGRDLGELFEYNFDTPVTVKQGESAMLPFLQQRVNTRKLLIYSESFGLNPMNAAEITNSSGKTLDGGPITVYDKDTYAGEALVETLKAGDKRLISYGVDLGTRISTTWDSSRADVREIHFARGVLTTRNAVQETKTYTIRNVDPTAKTLIIEHAQRSGFKLVDLKPLETTSTAYRFEVKLAAAGTVAFAVKEERVYDQTLSISSMTPDVIATWVQNRSLTDAARLQLQGILAKKREIIASDAQLRQIQADTNTATQDQDRLRRNIDSLRSVAGQQEQVQNYARQLAANEARIATMRDQEAAARKAKATQEAELNALIEKATF